MTLSNSTRTNLFLCSLQLVIQILSVVIFFDLLKPAFSEPVHVALPKPELCASRKIHFKFKGHGYYATWFDKSTRNLFLNWLNARNWCRERCMDLVSLETAEEIDLVKLMITKGKVEYSWTSGRLCDFEGCNRKDLQPANINGWFWSATEQKLRPTNEKSRLNDWSHTGATHQPQPDNREGKKNPAYAESCLAYLNDYYKDGLKWHDVGCHHIKSFLCEDSPELLKYARAINKNKALKF